MSPLNTQTQNDGASVSVVIPTKDRLKHLQRVLPSYLSQEGLHELIVVDDGSRDGTSQWLAETFADRPGVVVVTNPSNRGLPAARNIGLDRATGSHVLFGEDDVYFEADYLRRLVRHLAESGCDIIASRLIYLEEGETEDDARAGADRASRPLVDTKHLVIDASVGAPADTPVLMTHALMLAKAEVFTTVRFDAGYRVNFWREESDFQLRAQKQGFRMIYCPHVVAFSLPKPADRGGAHGSNRIRYEYWALRNNRRFVIRHRQFIEERFGIRNVNLYLLRFAFLRLTEVAMIAWRKMRRRAIGR